MEWYDFFVAFIVGILLQPVEAALIGIIPQIACIPQEGIPWLCSFGHFLVFLIGFIGALVIIFSIRHFIAGR